MALRLYAIIPADAPHDPSEPDGFGSVVSFVAFRDVCAVVSEQAAFTLEDPNAVEVDRHRGIVDNLFRRTALLPAPVGVVFRGEDVLRRWMELHYVSLTGALEFVEDRVAARVHIVRADGRHGEREAGSDLAAAAADAFRALRRRAMAAVPLRLEEVTGLVLSAAFLVDRELWREFADDVEAQRQEHPLLQFDLTGPWAPYDFVRMQFGG